MISSHIDDRWVVERDGEKVRTDRYGRGLRYRARYRAERGGKQLSKAFATKRDAKQWLQDEAAKHGSGTWIDPAKDKVTVGQWCDTWIAGYASRKVSTVKQAEVHLRVIKATFADVRLRDVKPSDVNAWVAAMQKDERADSYVYAVYRRFAQIMSDAVLDGLLQTSPCSRRTSPRKGRSRPYVCTTADVWAIYEAFPSNLRPAVLLAAFAGLRLAECAGLRASDVDFMRGIITPAVQYPAEPLKTDYSQTPIPIPHELSLMLAKAVADGAGEYVVTNEIGRQATPWSIQITMRDVRDGIEGLPEGFRFHDLRHYFASMLIAAGLDVKVVQTRMRHKSATTTLNTYGHMFPDKDETALEAVAAAMAERPEPAESPLSTKRA
ncbi:tyrosine-type recombinase/integrase [Dermacoccus nishinomiyaensis]|uniref:tyrosine-type recombinase/integrase n=1 Tax=Dermacoccus nishinomiyaensis TaxID=1274 RepID=UPI001EF723F6|nr:site-specific integrase [Dermacoccus nishinomiyaensis]MCG7430770.1 site-specific integrase [Dermacoccus nishinomiyaensis]